MLQNFGSTLSMLFVTYHL